jgi:hypothetical protein
MLALAGSVQILMQLAARFLFPLVDVEYSETENTDINVFKILAPVVSERT